MLAKGSVLCSVLSAQVPSWRHKCGSGKANLASSGGLRELRAPIRKEMSGAPQSQRQWLLRTRPLCHRHHSGMSVKREVVVTVKHMQTEGKLHLRVRKTSTIAEASTSDTGPQTKWQLLLALSRLLLLLLLRYRAMLPPSHHATTPPTPSALPLPARRSNQIKNRTDQKQDDRQIVMFRQCLRSGARSWMSWDCPAVRPQPSEHFCASSCR